MDDFVALERQGTVMICTTVPGTSTAWRGDGVGASSWWKGKDDWDPAPYYPDTPEDPGEDSKRE